MLARACTHGSHTLAVLECTTCVRHDASHANPPPCVCRTPLYKSMQVRACACACWVARVPCYPVCLLRLPTTPHMPLGTKAVESCRLPAHRPRAGVHVARARHVSTRPHFPQGVRKPARAARAPPKAHGRPGGWWVARRARAAAQHAASARLGVAPAACCSTQRCQRIGPDLNAAPHNITLPRLPGHATRCAKSRRTPSLTSRFGCRRPRPNDRLRTTSSTRGGWDVQLV